MNIICLITIINIFNKMNNAVQALLCETYINLEDFFLFLEEISEILKTLKTFYINLYVK